MADPRMPHTQPGGPAGERDAEEVRPADDGELPREVEPNEAGGRVGRGRDLDEDIGE